MTAYEHILDALSDAGMLVSVHGGSARAQCPAHGSRGLTLHVSLGRNHDRALLHCHAGCSSDAVLAALGLKARDLFDGRPPAGYEPPPPPVLTPWDRAMLELSERFRLGWHGPGDYPPAEHVLHRIEQAQGTTEDDDQSPAPWINTPAPKSPWMSDAHYADYCAWVTGTVRPEQP